MYIQYSVSILLETSSSCHLVAQCEFSQETNRRHMCRSHLTFGEIWLEEDQDNTGDNLFQERKKPQPAGEKRCGRPLSYYTWYHMCSYWVDLYEFFQTGQTRTNKVKEMHEKCSIQQTVSIVIICAIITQIHESNKNKSGIGPHCCPLLVQIWYRWWEIYTEVNLKCRRCIPRSIKKL